MNDLTVIAASLNGAGGKPVTMTSLEMVEFINGQRTEGAAELRHDHFMAKVPKVLGEEAAPNFRGSYIGRDGTARPCYIFPKREACLMAMSYSYDLQAKVFDKMTELEEQVAKPTLNPANLSRLQLIELAMQAEQERLQIEAKLAIAAPKAEALDRISTADVGSLCITNAAKALQVPPKKLFSWMHEHQWLYRRPGTSGWIAYQHRIQCGWLEHKVTTVERSDGTEKVVEQVLVTPKGLAKLSEAVDLKRLAA